MALFSELRRRRLTLSRQVGTRSSRRSRKWRRRSRGTPIVRKQRKASDEAEGVCDIARARRARRGARRGLLRRDNRDVEVLRSRAYVKTFSRDYALRLSRRRVPYEMSIYITTARRASRGAA